jgi:hypothetical protein
MSFLLVRILQQKRVPEKPKYGQEDNMAVRKVWVIEEVTNGEEVSQRQSLATITDNGDDDWSWNRPDEVLSENGKAVWDEIMGALSDVGGNDYRQLVCGVALKDYCLRFDD